MGHAPTVTPEKEELRKQLARYGIWNSPITNAEVDTLFANGFTVDQAYGVATDMANGFDFDTSMAKNGKEGD